MKWLNRLEILLTFALIIACLGALGLLAMTAGMAFFGTPNGGGIPLRVYDLPIEGLAAGDATIGNVAAEVMVRPQGPAPLAGLLYLLMWAPGAATGLLAVFTLVRALRRARSGDRALFSADTARLLRRFGCILIVGSLVSAVIGTVAEVMLSSMLLTESYPFYGPSAVQLVAIFGGFVALGVSEIVRRGVALLEEVEATI
ncbi:DUF2975 domain-containing protein [Nonomuraea sp. NPDC050022]|uniref:DUF2975 domain-containing protein n=1 Tax=unclassified Nonomuraea TaxID=2593643 RepID=UPI0033CF4DFB